MNRVTALDVILILMNTLTQNMNSEKILIIILITIFSKIMILLGMDNAHKVEKFSTYPFMEWYEQRRMNPKQYCGNFICELSGLNHSQIETIVNEEIKIRNEKYKKCTQYVKVNWNQHISVFAQHVAELCLPPTGNTTIFEHCNLQSWATFDDTETINNIVMLIAIQTRMNKFRAVLDLHDSIMEHVHNFNENNYVWEPFKPGTTVHIGCGYVMAANRTHQVDHMVCAYGFFVLDNSGSILKVVDLKKPYPIMRPASELPLSLSKPVTCNPSKNGVVLKNGAMWPDTLNRDILKDHKSKSDASSYLLNESLIEALFSLTLIILLGLGLQILYEIH